MRATSIARSTAAAEAAPIRATLSRSEAATPLTASSMRRSTRERRSPAFVHRAQPLHDFAASRLQRRGRPRDRARAAPPRRRPATASAISTTTSRTFGERALVLAEGLREHLDELRLQRVAALHDAIRDREERERRPQRGLQDHGLRIRRHTREGLHVALNGVELAHDRHPPVVEAHKLRDESLLRRRARGDGECRRGEQHREDARDDGACPHGVSITPRRELATIARWTRPARTCFALARP